MLKEAEVSPGKSPDRPLLRGVFHVLAFLLAIPAVGMLLSSVDSGPRRAAAAVYGATLLLLLGISGLYHRVTWTKAARARIKLIDHSAIFLLIAGSYTPICLFGVGGFYGQVLCAIIWMGALLGIGQTLFWPGAPRFLHVGIYVVLGWAGAFGIVSEAAKIGSPGVLLHVGGGVLYTLGAVSYARKRPDPFPTVFGYHEIYHLLVVIACGCLFEVVRRCLLSA